MIVGRSGGSRSGPGHLIGAAGLNARDCRHVACPRCEVKPVARCLNQDGSYAKQSHPERRAAFKEAQS